MSVQPIPEGYHSVTPYLIIKGAEKGMEFYKAVFNAEELMRIDGPEDAIMHAEMQLGSSRIMVSADGHAGTSIAGQLGSRLLPVR